MVPPLRYRNFSSNKRINFKVISDDNFAFGEYKKQELKRFRETINAKTPFWYIDTLYGGMSSKSARAGV